MGGSLRVFVTIISINLYIYIYIYIYIYGCICVRGSLYVFLDGWPKKGSYLWSF